MSNEGICTKTISETTLDFSPVGKELLDFARGIASEAVNSLTKEVWDTSFNKYSIKLNISDDEITIKCSVYGVGSYVKEIAKNLIYKEGFFPTYINSLGPIVEYLEENDIQPTKIVIKYYTDVIVDNEKDCLFKLYTNNEYLMAKDLVSLQSVS